MTVTIMKVKPIDWLMIHLWCSYLVDSLFPCESITKPFLNTGQNISQTISCLLQTQLPDPVVHTGSHKGTCSRMHCFIGCRSRIIRLSQVCDFYVVSQCLQTKAVQICSSSLKYFGVLSLGPYAGLHSYGNFRPNHGSGYQMSGIAKLITRLSEIGLNCMAEQVYFCRS